MGGLSHAVKIIIIKKNRQFMLIRFSVTTEYSLSIFVGKIFLLRSSRLFRMCRLQENLSLIFMLLLFFINAGVNCVRSDSEGRGSSQHPRDEKFKCTCTWQKNANRQLAGTPTLAEHV